MFVFIAFVGMSQSTTYTYYNENVIMKDEVTNATVSQQDNPFRVVFVIDAGGKSGHIMIEDGAQIEMYDRYDYNSYTADWYYYARDNSGRWCYIHINTALEESSNIVYLRIQFSDYSFYYKLRRLN